jgi:hypothetical protein
MSQIAERVHIGAYVAAEQRQQLVELAQRDDRSVSSVLRIAIAEHLERSLTERGAGFSTSPSTRLTPEPEAMESVIEGR